MPIKTSNNTAEGPCLHWFYKLEVDCIDFVVKGYMVYFFQTFKSCEKTFYGP